MSMKVTGPGATKGPDGIKRKGRTDAADGGDFAARLNKAAGGGAVEGAVEPSSLGAVDSVLAVQEVPDATDGRSRGLALAYGEDLLDRLEGIRRAILVGSVAKDDLAALAQTMRAKRRETADPGLAEILDEIELRAEVEIAKLTRRD